MFKSTVMIKKLLGGFSLLLLLTSFGFAYFHTQGMSATDMPMPGCPFMNDGVPVLCTMSPLEHIEAWQDMFVAIPALGIALLLSLILLSVFIFNHLPQKWPVQANRFFQPAPSSIALKQSFSSYLTKAFSDGILNPKLF
ncbi:MAG: hypothetical protein KBC62_02395 [Candidatus Pacebacteria bacterium]|nr:hypothetical protein [Candidatus Paceibacterota bacterium]MBP9842833.1 hypothetical protein [Candidatus Paceibacterota bacterium]